MNYRIILTASAVKDRKRIDGIVRVRIDRALQELQSEPRPKGVKKLTAKQNDWRIRVGDYRILYEIDDEQSLVTVWRIAHRRDVYR